LAAERALDDHRAAIDHSAAEGRPDLVVRHVSALCGLWWMLPHAEEGTQRLEVAGDPADEALGVAALMVRAAASLGSDDFAQSRELLVAATERGAGLGLSFEPLLWGFRAVTELGRQARGLAHLAVGRAADADAEWGPFLDHCEGDLRLMAGDVREALVAYDRELAASDWDEYLWFATSALSTKAVAHHLQGEHDLAVTVGQAAVDLAAAEPRLLSSTGRSVIVAYPLAAQGQVQQAAALLTSCFSTSREHAHLQWARGEPLGGVAGLAHHRGDHDVAGTLLGVTAASGQAFRSPWQFALQVHYARAHEAATGAPPTDGGLSVDQAVSLAEEYVAAIG
jgi:hypothetical protein